MDGDVPVPTDSSETGDAVVDAALADLARLPGLPLEEHPAVVDAVQVALADRLAEHD